MNGASSKFFKPALCILMVVLMVVVSFAQKSLNGDRDKMGLTRVTVLENAPPVLAFTTVALGGFRGLISNALWMRAMDLQDEGKYFEMVQLADWITKLQPYFSSIWVVQAWNMAYNISIKFDAPKDRWLWVERGIELLRDQGLKYNPKETLIYRELAWFFQHKIGSFLDDAQMYYKYHWKVEMDLVVPKGRADYKSLLNPQTKEEAQRVELLKSKYKMDPVKMKEVDEKYGPLEWRLPETHAVYWAYVGLQYSKKQELITLRRSIYQSMQTAFQRGRVIENRYDTNSFQFGPNLDMIPNASRAYEDMMKEDLEMKDHISIGHRNFLRDAVYFLYMNNRRKSAQEWFDYLKLKYPDARLDKPPMAIKDLSLDEYSVARTMEEVGDTSQDRTKSLLEGFLKTAYYNLAIGEEDQFTGLINIVDQVHARYNAKTKGSEQRVPLPAIDTIKQGVLTEILSPASNIPPEAAAVLRTRLNIPVPPPQAEASTNSPASPR